MQRFYFDLLLGSAFTPDDVGHEIASPQAAEIEAMRTAAELARDRLLTMQVAASDAVRVEVRDEARQLVFTVTVSIQVDRTGLPPSCQP